MEIEANNSFVNEVEGVGKRPQFLTTLCVLSFICVGLVILLMAMNTVLQTPERMAESIEEVRRISPAQADQMEAAYEQQQNSTIGKIQNYLVILMELVSLLGVIMMFNLKRAGFYIYAGIELIPYTLMLFGGGDNSISLGDMGGGAVKAFVTLFVLFDLAFVVMYALNLKHMKK